MTPFEIPPKTVDSFFPYKMLWFLVSARRI